MKEVQEQLFALQDLKYRDFHFQRKLKAVCFCWKQTAFAALRLPCTPESVSQQ